MLNIHRKLKVALAALLILGGAAVLFGFVLQTKKDSDQRILIFRYITFDSTIMLDLPSPRYNIIHNPKIIVTDSSINLFFHSWSHLFLYNLSKAKLLRDIYVSTLRYAYYINADSILVFRDPKYFMYDSAFLLIDIDGNIKRVYSFKGAPVLMKNEKRTSLDSALYILEDFVYAKGKAFFFVQKLKFDYINDNEYKKLRYPLFAYLDLQRDTFVFIDKIKNYPFLDTLRLIDKSFGYPFMETYKNFLLISHRYTKMLQIYDFVKDSVFYADAGSYFIDTVYTDKDIESYDQGKGYGQVQLISDKYILRLAVVTKHTFSKIILDSNFNKLGEFFYNLNLIGMAGDTAFYLDYEKSFATPGKIFIKLGYIQPLWVDKDTYIKRKRDSLAAEQTTDYCEFTFSEGNLMYPDKLETLLKNLIPDSNFIAIIVPVYHSCHSCVEHVLLTYSSGYQIYQHKNIYLIAIGENLAGIQGELMRFGINPKGEKVIIDTLSKYVNLYRNIAMEHLAEIKEGKLVNYKSFAAPEIDSLVRLMIGYLIK